MGISWKGLYAIVDPAHCGGRDPERVAEAILRGGCAVLQVRVKADWSDAAMLTLARRVRARCDARGVPFVVNDRPDLAMLAGAGGLHLGQDDVRVEDARRIVGGMAVGRSTHTPSQARNAIASGADLIGYGPVFSTGSKERPDPVVGLEGLGAVCAESPVPVVAIGGLDGTRARDARRAGASLVAVISALCGAEEPERAASALNRAASEEGGG